MFIPRALGGHIGKLMTWFPVVSLTGPRQSGKSTLLQGMFPDMSYLNLEDPGIRALAEKDPMGFLASQSNKLIIDEAQYVPDLFSAVQLVSDQRGTPGQYILSGSQNFLLMERITQSLAGRVGVSHLLPLSFSEVAQASAQEQLQPMTVDEFLLRGGYPRMYNVDIPTDIYFANYIRTYIERDVSGLLGVRRAEDFRKFLISCAHRAGNLVNYTTMGNELDISFQTVKSWLSVLESSFITFTLPAYHHNPRKALTKTPKLYFYDTGLLCFLLGISSAEQLLFSPFRGAIFENFVIAETAKKYLHAGKTPQLSFYRDDSKREIDLLDATDGNLHAYEIKASHTFKKDYGRHLVSVGQELDIPAGRRQVIYQGQHGSDGGAYSVVNVEKVLL
ncbi:ATP-binding protein [Corynebacterium sp. sy039]|uniref:ATP-binding protein n=1 Tax=Corynebacterium sp. sy039 TaxID=2599641 RepID=UPI0011B80AEC|nr:ATP-binding protein [Corynebacterium sp. sy039]QDZ43316.1 ATP-binding protein [Corynebacterium sp. sy039]